MKTRNMVLCALFAALMAICAWISIPAGSVSFTLQTFGLFLALLVLGGKWGSLSILLYLCLGAVGIPVFSGFQGGIGALLGPTGGFLFGFMLTALLYWALTAWKDSFFIRLIGLILGLFFSYIAGYFWFSRFAVVNFWLWCLPFVLPDAGKLVLAFVIARRLRRVT